VLQFIFTHVNEADWEEEYSLTLDLTGQAYTGEWAVTAA
jgi:hypothetical protein